MTGMQVPTEVGCQSPWSCGHKQCKLPGTGTGNRTPILERNTESSSLQPLLNLFNELFSLRGRWQTLLTGGLCIARVSPTAEG